MNLEHLQKNCVGISKPKQVYPLTFLALFSLAGNFLLCGSQVSRDCPGDPPLPLVLFNTSKSKFCLLPHSTLPFQHALTPVIHAYIFNFGTVTLSTDSLMDMYHTIRLVFMSHLCPCQLYLLIDFLHCNRRFIARLQQRRISMRALCGRFVSHRISGLWDCLVAKTSCEASVL